jgi:hypothetical protein
MRIPIPIIRQRVGKALVVPGRCPSCGAEQGFDVQQEQLRVWVAFLPVGGQNTHLAGRCRACGNSAPADALKHVKVPLLLRHGWLFFIVIPALVVGGGYGIEEYLTHKTRAAEHAREEESRQKADAEKRDLQQAEADCRAAFKKAHEAEAACMKSVNEAMKAVTKDIDLERERAPKDVAALMHAPKGVIGDADVPDSAYFGGQPCPIAFPEGERSYDPGGKACGREMFKPPEEIRAAGAKIAETAKALRAPDRFAVVTFGCNDRTCASTAAWIDASSKTLLAVARATKPKSPDQAADKKALAELLGKKLAAWK